MAASVSALAMNAPNQSFESRHGCTAKLNSSSSSCSSSSFSSSSSPLPCNAKASNHWSKLCLSSIFPPNTKRSIFSDIGIGLMSASIVALTPLDADATRIEYYATVGEPLCELIYAKSGLGYCDVSLGSGIAPPFGELINIHYTARFGDGRVFDSSYKRGRPLTMRIGVGKVIRGLDQGIFGGEGVPPMQAGGKRKLMIPPKLAYGPEPAGCFSGDCNIPGNATLLYDIKFMGLYNGNGK